MPRRPKTTETVPQPATTPAEPKKSKNAVIIAALQAHPDKMPKELAQLLQAEGWDINAQRISTIKSKLKAEQKAPTVATTVAPKKAPTPKAEEGISFDSLKKAKQMAEQLGGIKQAKAAIAALAELVD